MGPKKNQKMSIGAFLQDESLGPTGPSSWADQMEDMPITTSDSRTSYSNLTGYGGERRAFTSASGMDNGSFDRRDAFPSREQLPLPTQPPYTAHIGNMSFDTTQGDVSDFFRDCEVTNVRIVEDKLDRKPKGFGYVEFATLDGLKKAISYNGSNLAGRNIRISVADPPKDRQDGRDFSDWSRKGPLPELPGQQRRVSDRPAGFQGRSFDNMSDAGSERGSRRPFEQGDGKIRDFSNWERKGPLFPAASATPSFREGGRQGSKDGQHFRKSSPAWGEPRSQDGSRPPRRELQEKPMVEKAPTASELDNQWRTKMKPDPSTKSPTPEASNPPSPAPAPIPATRAKLNLQKRTVSEADPGLSPGATSATDSKASPFGAARPVDTSAREKELEGKRQLAIRQRKEADEKAKAEKAEEKRLAKEQERLASEKVPKPTEYTDAKDNEDGGDVPQNRSNFEILRRASDAANGMTADEDEEAEAEEALVADDKDVKPREIVRDAPSGKTNGGDWRSKSSKEKEPPSPETTAATLEEDGWSTVSKSTKQRNNRRSNQAPRAIAS